MPMPVSAARECLTEEAARVLDEAITVARRRSHSQTTSLHAVSALLSLPNSALKEACHRGRSFAYSPRLQFRALELSVGVSLDRLPSSKALENDPPPPISNSLMAAIKRSQANQRRHPETFHLYQQAQNQFSLTSVKVELKHFILSILDDPIVSRVFGEAGFRSTDIKIAILHPPTPIPRFSKSRYPPPLFLCNLPDSDSKGCGFNFPFAVENCDDNCRRIGEVLVKKNKKNPLLVGFRAKEALKGFRESVEKGKVGVLPVEIDGLSVNCIEKEVSVFVCEGGSEETMGLKFKELGDVADRSTGCGIVVDFGELGVLVNGKSIDAVNYVVARVSELVEVRGEKLWLIGSVESYETYLKFVDRFPTLEKDWDLHMLPITAATPTNGGPYSKSSLMGSFVPFGGFFPAPSEFKNLPTNESQSVSRCDLCNEKYEQEISDILKGGSTTSTAVQHLPNLSSWLRNDESVNCKSAGPLQARDGEVQNARIVGLERKWNDICHRLQHPQSPQQNKPQVGSPQVGSPVPAVGRFDSDANRKGSNGKDYILNESVCTDHHSSITSNLTNISPRPRKNMEIEIPSLQHKVLGEVSNIRQLEMKNPTDTCYPVCSLRHQPGLTTSSSVTSSVTTDLGLGTLYASSKQEHRSSPNKELPNVSGYVSATIGGISKSASSNQIMQSSFCSGLRGQSDEKDFKHLWKVLYDTVGWQEEAICTISQTISSCRNGYGKLRGPTYKGDIWLTFLGPDKVGKRRIASALAHISRGDLWSVDLDPANCFSSQDSIFDYQDSNSYNVRSRGKTVVGYIAEKLRRKPHSVALLENIDKADLMTQNSLTRAIKTGRFPDSDGREININSVIFVTTLSHNSNVVTGKGTSKFSEDRILGVKGSKMKILVESDARDATRTSGSNVLLMPMKGASGQVFVNKRKIIDSGNSMELLNRNQKVPRACIDLNLPVDETEEGDDYGGHDSDSSSESLQLWLEDFLNQVDQKVVFKPFDFDTLAQKILKDVERVLRKTLGSGILLEIDPEVMLQILAAFWLSNNERAVENWIEQILQKSFVEVQQKHHLITGSILKLVALEGFPMEEQAFNVCLPANISVN